MSDALIFTISVLTVMWLLIASTYLAALVPIWSGLSWRKRILMVICIIFWPVCIVVMLFGLSTDDEW